MKISQKNSLVSTKGEKKGIEILWLKTPINPALDDRPFIGNRYIIGRKWAEMREGDQIKVMRTRVYLKAAAEN